MATFEKIWSTRVNKGSAETYIGQPGEIFYNGLTGNLRLSDGRTPGGLPLDLSANNLTVTGDIVSGGNLSVAGNVNAAYYFGDGGFLTNVAGGGNNIDGGLPSSQYGGTTKIDGGVV